MDNHKNARLSFRSREALARMVVEQGCTRKRPRPLPRERQDGRQVGRAVIGAGDRRAAGSQFAAPSQPAADLLPP